MREEIRVEALAQPISHFTDAVRAGGFLYVSNDGGASFREARVIAPRTGADAATGPELGGRVLSIEVGKTGGQTHLVVRDKTRPPPKPGLSEAERWREVGLTPDGKPADPKKFE